MFAQPSTSAGSGIELLSSDSRANLYAATHDTIRCLAARQSIVNSQDSHYVALVLVELAAYQSGKRNSRTYEVPSQTVHPSLFQARPGLVVWQVSWHPGSESHFAILTSDSFWRMYHIDDLTVAEQTFKLQLSPDRALGINLDEDLESSRQHAVGFAFGAAHAWERFTVYFVCSDGSLFVLCPVAPFQAAIPLSDVDQLVSISRCAMDESSHSTTQAWLDQALPQPSNRASSRLSPAQQANEGPSVSSLMEKLLSVQPHALDSHGESKDARAPTSGAAGHADEAAAVLACRYADTCSAVVVATAAGMVQTFVVAGEVSPTWAQQSPACITQGRHLVAIRSEVPVVPPSTDVFILRDVVQLQQTVPARQQAALLQHAAAARLRLQLHADPSAPDRLYAVDAHGAHAISLPWLPILANCLAPSSLDTGLLEDQLDLLLAVAEQLWHPVHQGQTIVSAAPLGSALQPAGLLLMDSQSWPHCLRPSRLSSPHQDQDDSIGLADDRKAVEASSVLFSNVLQGPEQITAPAPPDPPAPTGTGNSCAVAKQ
ncbi:hypothetical protein ABBQ38_013707 [Trebouxia sp. C0009 RCD-2024]